MRKVDGEEHREMGQERVVVDTMEEQISVSLLECVPKGMGNVLLDHSDGTPHWSTEVPSVLFRIHMFAPKSGAKNVPEPALL
jgi:hypothetical protein